MLDFSTTCPLPQAVPGATWRYLTNQDAAALNLLIQRIEAVDNPPYRSSWQDVTQFFSPNTLWAAVGAFDQQGIMRGFGHLRVRDRDVKDVICYGGVDPNWRRRGIGHASLGWQTQTSEYILARLSDPGQIIIFVEDDKDEWISHLLEAGYEKQATFVELAYIFADHKKMIADTIADRGVFLGRPYDGSPKSPFVELIQWTDDLSEQVRLATGRLSGGQANISRDAWKDGWEHFASSASFILLDKHTDRSRVVGYILCSSYTQDFDVLGRRQGTIDMLAIDSDYYDYLPDMFDAVIRSYEYRGFDAIGASAERSDNSSELTVYDECGFNVCSRNFAYTKIPASHE